MNRDDVVVAAFQGLITFSYEMINSIRDGARKEEGGIIDVAPVKRKSTKRKTNGLKRISR